MADNSMVSASCLPNTIYDLPISGESMRNHGGFSISSAGDVNGDGLDDLIIGSDSAGKHTIYLRLVYHLDRQ
jgi:hypothetical protein